MGDTFARFEGEEFALLLPAADESFAAQVAERIRSLIASMEMNAPNGTHLTITASLGVASLSANDQAVGDLLARSDVALYRAKNGGRNRVESAS